MIMLAAASHTPRFILKLFTPSCILYAATPHLIGLIWFRLSFSSFIFLLHRPALFIYDEINKYSPQRADMDISVLIRLVPVSGLSFVLMTLVVHYGM
jgi:hypothetical protein